MNPKIITWAREKAGLSVEDLAEKMGRGPDEIRLWENGRDTPSYVVLEQMAYRYLKIPLAVFFFPTPPNIEDPIKKFRRLPSHELKRLSFDTRQKIKLAQAYQESLEVLLEGFSKRKFIFRELSPVGLDPSEFAKKTRDYLGISLRQQIEFDSSETALKAWRAAIEKSSIFTFKDSFEDKFMSGFSLVGDEYPVIFVNNSNAFSRQLFTLIHELGHILYGVSGVTDFDESYIDHMENRQRTLEITCNKFAGHFLVPNDSFREDIQYYHATGSEAIFEIADKYCVSREVILRRLLDKEVVTREYYEKMATEWNKEYLGRGKKSAGGNYYLTRLAYLGEGYTKVAFDNYYKGRITKTELAYHLNINSHSLPKLEVYMR